MNAILVVWIGVGLVSLAGCAATARSPEPVRPSSTPVTAAALVLEPSLTTVNNPVALARPVLATESSGTIVALDSGDRVLNRALPVPTPAVQFAVDRAEVEAAGCAVLSWSAVGARRVRLLGRDVPASGSRSVCPDQESTYYLWFEGADGRPGERALTVRQVAPTSAPAAAASEQGKDERPRDTPAPPTLEPTPCDTECVVIMPTETPRPPRPTRAPPTDEPQPTEVPPATDEPPTALPEPTEAPPATPPPDPTDEPSPPSP